MKDEERHDPARTSSSPVVRQHSRRRLPLPPFVTRYLPQTEHRKRTGLQLLDRGGGGATLPPKPPTSHRPKFSTPEPAEDEMLSPITSGTATLLCTHRRASEPPLRDGVTAPIVCHAPQTHPH